MVYNRHKGKMKKLLSVVVLVAFTMNMVHAQTFTQENNEMPNESVVAETVENGVIVTAEDLTLLRDASFLTEQEYGDMMAIVKSDPDRVTAGVLAILLGGIGVHHFYTGQTVRGILDIVFCWTGIPALIGLIEGIIWLCEDDAAWAERVEGWRK